jgi:hypothetical protein
MPETSTKEEQGERSIHHRWIFSCLARKPPPSYLTAATIIYAIGAGNTAAAGTRLALQLILDNGFKLFSFQKPNMKCWAVLFIVTTSLY